ncbi:hypothetical protein [Larkinella soli]|uniref:hypothetical protein n=1 Tax=Larkinella soli TaxID=1770527 RepID=UPI000FFCBFA3|nr:hypothetical protein [Larkinella soli]
MSRKDGIPAALLLIRSEAGKAGWPYRFSGKFFNAFVIKPLTDDFAALPVLHGNFFEFVGNSFLTGEA